MTKEQQAYRPDRDTAGIALLEAVRAAIAAGLAEIEIQAIVNHARSADVPRAGLLGGERCAPAAST